MKRRTVAFLAIPLVSGFLALLGLAGYGAVLLLTREPAGVEKPAPEPAADPRALARQAGEILQTNCHRCHGEGGVMEGGFNYVMDPRRLAEGHKIIPGRPEQSRLIQRIVEGEMPPEGEARRPGPDEIAVLRRWVEAGAPAFAPAESPPSTLPLADLPRLIRDDLAGLPERDRRFARYFTLTHLHNAGLTEDELQTHRAALSKLVNSLSWGREVVPPRPINAAKTVLRIDLRDFKWEGATWERVLADYPYGSTSDDEAGRELTAATDCRLPYVRADWFTAVASRPPLYYELLQMPATDRELESLLRVDAARDVRGERVVRAGFNNSGVSRNNRVIERYESGYGAYWKSYDFAGGTGSKNIFACPLGPGAGANSFQHDGGEMIFELPNGLHAYLLADSSGKRLDQAPLAIVSDPKRPERAVIAGLSCLSCHSRGFNDKADQVRDHVRKNPGAFPQTEADTILALYPPRDRFEGLLRGDNDRYRRALEKTGARWGVSDPIETLAARFEGDVDLALAAAEVGVPTRELVDAIAGAPAMGRALGVLRSEGGTVPRRLFANSFGDLLRALHRGEPLRPAGIPLPPALKERVVFDLPDWYEEVKTGGGGRYLIFYFKKAKKLAVFDVFQARIVREIEVPTEDVRYAAGRDKLLVVLPGQKIIHRYDLHTFEREKTVPVPGGGKVLTALMGSDSQGPLGLWCGGNLILMDVDRMEPLEVKGNNFSSSPQWGFGLRVSADGQTFLGWNPGIWPAGFAVMRLSAGKAVTGSSSLGSFNEQWVTPNADGSLIIRHDGHLFSRELKDFSADGFRGWMLQPTEDPHFFLAARGLELTVCTTADCRAVFTLNDKALEKMDGSSMTPRWYNFQGEPRVRYLPGANLLVFLPPGEKQVVIRPFNLIDELEEAGKDYLFVLSQPKTRARAGSTYTYQLDVKSKAAAVTYKLEKGPDGMTVSAGGEVRWNVPKGQAGKTAPVILNVSNAAGKEIFHTFEVVTD